MEDTFNLGFKSILDGELYKVNLEKDYLAFLIDEWLETQALKTLSLEVIYKEIFFRYIIALEKNTPGLTVYNIMNKYYFEKWVNEVILDRFIEALANYEN